MNRRVNRLPFLLIRRILKLFAALPARWKWDFEVVHPERLPRTRRPLILACNHAALIDTAFLIQRRVEREVGEIPFIAVFNKADLEDEWEIGDASIADLAEQRTAA